MLNSRGFDYSCLLLVRKKINAANNEGVNILSAAFISLSGTDAYGNSFEALEMVCTVML